jgi:NADH:ubiquinone oxidoreductase subunit 4 (subunit M)
MGREQVLQGLAGVLCIVASAIWLQDPKYLAAYTAVSGFGFTLLGNLLKGPNQVTKQEAERMVRAKSDPPPPMK